MTGLLISLVPGLPQLHIEPELIFIIFLPPLLYDAAFNMSWKELWRWRRIVSSFAFIVVFLTALSVAFVANWFIPGFSLALGFLLGGIVSPPDAVSAGAKCVEVIAESVQIVALEAPGEESARQTRPREDRHLLSLIPRSRHRVVTDADATGPRRLLLFRQAEVRAAADERREIVFRCIVIGSLQTLVRPVRTTKRVNTPCP